jgi:hypothetical protein
VSVGHDQDGASCISVIGRNLASLGETVCAELHAYSGFHWWEYDRRTINGKSIQLYARPLDKSILNWRPILRANGILRERVWFSRSVDMDF